MKKLTIFTIFILMTFCGSVSAGNKPIKNDVAIERLSSEKIIVTSAYAHGKDKGMIIYGKLRRRLGNISHRLILQGHIDVSILDPDGNELYQTETRNFRKLHVRNHHDRLYTYMTEIPFIASEGNTIRISFHDS